MSEINQRMEKSLSALQKNFVSLRTGIASPSLLDGIKVDYYGTPTAIQHLANISTPEPRTLLVQPFEKAMLSKIEKAIHTSDLGISPITDKDSIRLNLPLVTTEKRLELAKKAKALGEECKVSIRNIRRDQNDKLKKDDSYSEDELKKETAMIQNITNKFIAKVDTVVAEKEKSIMEI